MSISIPCVVFRLKFAVVGDQEAKEQDEIVAVLAHCAGRSLKDRPDIAEEFLESFLESLKRINRLFALSCHVLLRPFYYYSSKHKVQVDDGIVILGKWIINLKDYEVE